MKKFSSVIVSIIVMLTILNACKGPLELSAYNVGKERIKDMPEETQVFIRGKLLLLDYLEIDKDHIMIDTDFDGRNDIYASCDSTVFSEQILPVSKGYTGDILGFIGTYRGKNKNNPDMFGFEISEIITCE